MATTQNTYTGNGSTTNYSFTFEYIKQEDVKVTLDSVATTAFTFANATTLSLTTAPAVGAAIRIFRSTDVDSLTATFFPGSAIKAEDLNDNFIQNLYSSQETNFDVITSNTTAKSAVTTADNAVTSANSAVSTANTASNNATSAVNTANQASSDATYAVTQSNNAALTASSAQSVANAASSAVSQALLYTLVANVASIPSSPVDGDSIEIGDSTTIENFSPLSGLPTGYAGAAGLTVRIRWNAAGSTWVWLNYYANDTETRYLKRSLPQVYGDATNGSGKLQLNCENNSHGVKIQGPPHSAAANYTLVLPNTTGTNGQALVTDGAGQLNWNTVDKAVIELTDFAYEPGAGTSITNNQVLKYKTATSKWTVDTPVSNVETLENFAFKPASGGGVQAVNNDQVIKYKSATSKWTVEDAYVVNKDQVSVDLTIGDNHNASFMGPITITSGINIIVGSNSKFTVLN